MAHSTFVVAIDGPAGSGKSTIARLLAKKIGASYLDTGALYRAIALYLDGRSVPPEEGELLRCALAELTVSLRGERVLLGDEDVTDRIRTPRVDSIVSRYAALGPVRESLLDLQRSQSRLGPLVADGRDMGTVVFPEADVKIFLSASPEERARRRWKELVDRGETLTCEEVLLQVVRRDRIDSDRTLAPLREAEGAVLVDTTDLSVEEVLSRLCDLLQPGLSWRLGEV